MKKVIIFSMLSLFFVKLSIGQSNNNLLPLSELTGWLNIQYTVFKDRANSKGFVFERIQTLNNVRKYIYSRKVKEGKGTFTEFISYSVFDKASSLRKIEFSSSRDLLLFYSSQYSPNNFTPIECIIAPEGENQKQLCYINEAKHLGLNMIDNSVANSPANYTLVILKN